MRSIQRFATEHPLPFVVATPVIWMMTAGMAAYLAAGVLQLPPTHELPQSLGTLVATGCLVLMMWRWEWLRAAGVTALGSGRLWLVTTGLTILLVMAYQFAFLDGIVMGFSTVSARTEALAILRSCAVVGFVEETLFRGFLLYALVRVWGDTRRGLLAAVTLQALLFGLPHILQVFAGNPLDDTLMTMLNCFVSGLWYGALVLLGSSIWPAVLIHAATNASVQVGAASLTGFDPSATDYALATLAELPMVVVGLWVLLRKVPDPIGTWRQKSVAKASTSASTIGPLTLLLFVLASVLAGCQKSGVGRSSSPQAEPENYTLVRYAEDLEAVREAVGAKSVHLFGHSWGGIVAQRYATLHPERVRSIVLMGSGPPTREQTLQCQDAIRQRVIALMKQGII
jgi:membrane protease YdiL (CAAX protease family)